MALITTKRWTRSEYYRLAELDFFKEPRVELLDGKIVEITPQNRPRAAAIGTLNTLLVQAFGQTHIVRVQLPLDVDEKNQPEPDFGVVPIALVESSDPHPSTADWVVEVADSSLALDRQHKVDLYAKAGVPEYRIVNVKDCEIEVYQDLRDLKYRNRRTYAADEKAPFPGGTGEISAANLR